MRRQHLGVFDLLRQELDQGVELHELDAGRGEDLGARHAAERLSLHGIIAAVAVMVRQPHQPVVAVEQPIVHAPGVDPQAGKIGAAARHSLSQPFLDLDE